MKGLILKASLACDGGYYMQATENIVFVNRRSLVNMNSEVTNKRRNCDSFILCLSLLMLITINNVLKSTKNDLNGFYIQLETG